MAAWLNRGAYWEMVAAVRTGPAGAADVAVSAGSATTDINARLQRAPVALDEELAVLTDAGRILVRDPHAPPTLPPIPWQSSTVGWQQLAAGDFNGDGADEVVVSSADTLLVYVAPESSVSSVSYAGAYDPDGAFVIGDFDGPNESACTPIYLPLMSRP